MCRVEKIGRWDSMRGPPNPANLKFDAEVECKKARWRPWIWAGNDVLAVCISASDVLLYHNLLLQIDAQNRETDVVEGRDVGNRG